MMHELDAKSVVTWISLAVSVAGGSVGYGVLKQRVSTLERDVAIEQSAHEVLDKRLNGIEISLAVVKEGMGVALADIRRHHGQ